MATYIRRADYNSSDKKKEGFFKPENRYEAKQSDFEKIPGSPIAYWVSNKVKGIFDSSKELESYATPRQGMATNDNDMFIRFWYEVSKTQIGFNISSRENSKLSNLKWFPYNKGGFFQKWYGNQDFVVDWENDGYSIKKRKEEDLRNGRITANNSKCWNQEFYFKQGFTWSLINAQFGVRFLPQGFLFDVGGSSAFPDAKKLNFFMGLLTSKITNELLKILNPTMNFQVGNLKKIPIIFPKSDSVKYDIDTLTQYNINLSKEEWDSRETSWDFTKNELLKHKSDSKLQTAFENYCDYWKEKFYQLHSNEEELNRLFIEIYELQDELTPDVDLNDITILKQEADIVDGELVFNADEIMKQFISYAVGVMFGRYSIERDGLIMANLGGSCEKFYDMSKEATSKGVDLDSRQNLTKNRSLQEVNEDFEENFNAEDEQTTLLNGSFVDDDNVIPVLDDEYFSDDIVSRFVSFVKTTFGEESLGENIKFIEESLGKSLRVYFVKDFYTDHIKRYKKRPIYWMVSSPKKGFMSLFYMHRYTPDVFARVRNSYLTEYIAKLEAHKETLTLTVQSSTASNKDKKDADKAIKNIEAKLKEVIAFDRDAMMHYAQKSEEIDLDDGVKVNYCKFKDILFEFDKKLCK